MYAITQYDLLFNCFQIYHSKPVGLVELCFAEMDGIVVFSKHDDVIFIHSNDIFEEHIHKKSERKWTHGCKESYEFALVRLIITAKT